MISADFPEKRIETVYKYFSHHIRTNTAVIVAMLEAINEGLSDDSMTGMIMESGYLLDIFDRGMSVCFNCILNKEECSEEEEVELKKLVDIFVSKAVAEEIREGTKVDIPEKLTVKCEPYAFKNLLQIFMHEAALSSSTAFNVSYKDNCLNITPEKDFYETPAVFGIFSDVLSKQKIITEYDKKSIKLRFPDESINS